MTDRLSAYKNRGKKEDYLKRMKAQVVELRKAKKDEHLTKRRNLHTDDDLEEEALDVTPLEEVTRDPQSDIREILQALHGQDPEQVLQATRSSRKILSKESNPPIDQFVQANAIPRFVQLLSADSSLIQFEAAWVLTNVASGNEAQTRIAVEAGVSQAFLRLLVEAAPNVVEQVLWGLSNIAGTGAAYRDLLLQMGILPILVKLVESAKSRTLLATAAWCLSNLCRKMGSIPDFEALLPAIPVLAKLLENDSVAIVSDVCWALSYFTDGPNERLEAVCQARIIPHVVRLVATCNDKSILIPALRVIGNIVTGDDRQTQMILDAEALVALRSHLDKNTPAVTKKEVIWALSNVLAGNAKQIEAVVNEGLLTPLVDLLSAGDYKCQVEATWAICNFTCGGTSKQISLLFEHKALRPLCQMLEFVEARLIRVILDAFGNILRAAQDLNSLSDVMLLLDECGFVDRVEMLQMHELEEIYKRAAHLLTLYWSDSDSEGMENSDSNMSFGSPQALTNIVI